MKAILKGSREDLKKRFKKIQVVFASGEDQIRLIKELGYNGKIIKTKGVGIFNKKNRHKINKEKFKEEHSFLCVARLSEEKNLELLIDTFNELRHPLNIVGIGPLEKELKSRAKDNINFWGIFQIKIYMKYIQIIVYLFCHLNQNHGD